MRTGAAGHRDGSRSPLCTSSSQALSHYLLCPCHQSDGPNGGRFRERQCQWECKHARTHWTDGTTLAREEDYDVMREHIAFQQEGISDAVVWPLLHISFSF